MPASPTARRRRVGMELRRLREALAMTGADAAKKVEVSQSTITRIEAGKFALRMPLVKALLALYQAPTELTETLLELARASGERGWWQKFTENAIPDWFDGYVGLEAGAREARQVATHLIPGLFQTAEFTDALIRMVNPTLPEEQRHARVQLRMARQRRLTEDPLTVRAVLGEAVLHCTMGSSALTRAQLTRLTELARLPNVLLQILPFDSPAYVGLARPFSILDFDAGDPGVVFIEHLTGALYLDREDEIRSYRVDFEQLQAAGASPQQSITMIENAIERVPR